MLQSPVIIPAVHLQTAEDTPLLQASSSIVDKFTCLNDTCSIAIVVTGPRRRNPGVTDDLLQYEKSINSYLQYRGYSSDSNKANGLVQDEEAEFTTLRAFHSLLIAKTIKNVTADLVMEVASSKTIYTNDKRRKSTCHKT